MAQAGATVSSNSAPVFAGMQLKCAIVEEGLSEMSCMRVELLSKDKAIALQTLVGQPLELKTSPRPGEERTFLGICVSAEYLGKFRDWGRYLVEVRPKLWFLTRGQQCRIYQDKTVPEIVQEVLADYGFSAHFEKRLSKTYAMRDICVQYRETELDFINRLLEEEGIYYFFLHEGADETFVLADGPSAHMRMPGNAVIEYDDERNSFDPGKERFFEVVSKEGTTTGKVTLTDYNFETPGPKLLATRAMPKGKHERTGIEIYDYPGHFRTSSLGEDRVRVRVEAEAVTHVTWCALGNPLQLGVGFTFQLKNHPQTQGEAGFLVTRATHYIQSDTEQTHAGEAQSVITRGLDMGEGNADAYRVMVEIIPENTQYRAPLRTRWPEIQGIHTAVVVGPAGEEIHTDKYGRVKIKFHWDRRPPKDDTISVWVRCMMPWTGKSWGMIHIPRIGQEVVVQFEEGDPDRPVILGMLYNADTMPPYALPANKTQSGIKTDSSKTGGGFNELMMEDKKGAELVRFKAERDYTQIVQNDAKITVGLETREKGDMDLTVHRHLSETVKTGDHSFTVETGSQAVKIKTDKSETIEGKSTQTITGDVTEKVKDGNVARKLSKGSETTKLNMGDYTIKASMGKITMTAMQSITLKVGDNSVVIDQMGVTVKGMMIKLDAKLVLEAKSLMTNVKGDAMVMIKGGLTMIN